MGSTVSTYSHTARPWRPAPGAPPECRVCGVEVVGYTPADVRHIDEPVRRTPPPPADSHVVDYAVSVVEEALGRLADGGPDTDPELAARAAVEALYWRGALKTRRGTWRPPQQAAV